MRDKTNKKTGPFVKNVNLYIFYEFLKRNKENEAFDVQVKTFRQRLKI